LIDGPWPRWPKAFRQPSIMQINLQHVKSCANQSETLMDAKWNVSNLWRISVAEALHPLRYDNESTDLICRDWKDLSTFKKQFNAIFYL